MMKKLPTKSNSGFTLVETLVAVTILVIGVIGPLSLAARGISDGLFAQNQLTANLLAQEAMETIVNLRNSNIANIDNLVALPDGSTPDYAPFYRIWDYTRSVTKIETVGVDPVAGSLNYDCDALIDGANGCYVKDKGNGFYESVYEYGVSGPFIRQITLEKISDDELKVVVTIIWKNKTVEKRFIMSEYLYDK